jgi:NOL1/NOP2/fmu family ribosome biogenesis protein
MNTPWEYFTQHLQVVGWGTILFFVYKATKFLTKVGEKLSLFEKLSAEAHTAVTTALKADTHRLVELAEQQNRRWEVYMMGKAVHGGGHITVEDVSSCDMVSEQPEDL